MIPVARVLVLATACALPLVGAPASAPAPADGDFAFLYGRWRVQNRTRKPLSGSTEWRTFASTSVCMPILGGLGNIDEFRRDDGPFGTSLRFFDKAARRWSIYWVSTRDGVMQPPVTGGFADGIGIFEGDDAYEGRPVRTRYTWKADPHSPRWEQATSADGGKTWETNWVMEFSRDTSSAPPEWPPSLASLLPAAAAPVATPGRVDHLGEYPVVELRRYSCKAGGRSDFAVYFEAYFPEAFQQLGAIILGDFLERGSDTGFVWIRGFHDMPSRASINETFYGGPLWKEHSPRMNERLDDIANVLLLRPLQAEDGVSVPPAVDAVAESRARGIALAQIFAVREGQLDAFARQARRAFAAYEAAGARRVGALATLDVPNNFPRLPVRSDGPHLVWLGLVKDEQALESVRAAIGRLAEELSATGALREAPELLVLDPGPRSRLRWMPEWSR
jgi:hypothetical protein